MEKICWGLQVLLSRSGPCAVDVTPSHSFKHLNGFNSLAVNRHGSPQDEEA